jgi:biotin transport system substrate-specific component
MTKPSNLSASDVCRIGLFTAVTAVSSQIAVAAPFSPVPVTMSLFSVFLSGMIMRPRQAAIAQIVYLALGFAGVPVFSGLRGGPAALFGPTGGYLFSYPFMAAITAFLIEKLDGKRVPFSVAAAASALPALALCYLCGTAWLSVSVGTPFAETLAASALPFIPADMLKIALGAVIGYPIRKRAPLGALAK